MTDLIGHIITAHQGAGGLTSVNGPFFDYIPEKLPDGTLMTYPVCRMHAMPNPPLIEGRGASQHIERINLQFSYFDTSLSAVAGYNDSLHAALHRQVLTLTTDTFLAGIRTMSYAMATPEITSQGKRLFHGVSRWEFWLQRS